ncbi:MAG: trypsin-like peptidase domain-containing protein [Fuerstia sp.]|nr:trypsin-like peptidase domain-containing protein [Fuerstiella sp.]
MLAVALITSTTHFSTLNAGDARDTPLVRAVQQSRKSVVNIHTERMSAEEKDSKFFSSKSRKVTGMGTGIVIDERGYIVTNYHVIQDVDVITVTLEGGSSYEGRPVSYDRKHDLAIIRINATEQLTVMNMGTSSDLMLAETVYAVGNAFGYEHTVTSGIVSQLHRDVEVDETQSYENLIQTDASINPGNSGGPLINLNGEVIGINVAIRSGAQRIGFAIPIDDARRTIARLMSVERLNGIPHGLSTKDIKSAEEKKLVVENVTAESAADLCGIRIGDVIRSIRGIIVLDGTDLERSLLDLPRGKVVDVIVVRDGRDQTLQLTVGVGKPTGIPVATISQNRDVNVTTDPKTAEAPQVTMNVVSEAEQSVMNRACDLLGLRLEKLNDVDRAEIASKAYPGAGKPVRYNGGLRVVAVRADSVASRFVNEGDILLGLDGFETLGPKDISYILRDARISNSDPMKCQILRKGGNPVEGTITLTNP